MFQQWWNDFFHTRTNRTSSTFQLCGYLRMAYAFLIICDRLLLSMDFDWFFLSGILPCKQHYGTRYEDYYIREGSNYPNPPSLMCYLAGTMVSPEYSHYVFYLFHLQGIVQAVLLLLGICPKLQIIGLHLNMLSFHLHSDLIWDGEDNMFKMWNFLFLFLPLHCVTVYDRFNGSWSWKRTPATTTATTNIPNTTILDWPMWPFRLWQLELCFLYLGAGYSKLATDVWSSGNALYHVRCCCCLLRLSFMICGS
jgi:hypothetical protein